MKISVVIPNYNDVRIDRTLNSIYEQTYSDFEVIVIDSLSTKPEVLSIYQKYPISTLIREKDKGIFDALNKGIDITTGDLIVLAGSDDYFKDKTTFEDVVKLMKNNENISGSALSVEFFKKENVIRKWTPVVYTSSLMRMGVFPPHFGLFLKREVYDIVGKFKFDISNNTAVDTIWLIEMSTKIDASIFPVPNNIFRMEYGGTSTRSFLYIYDSFFIIMRAARKYGLTFWYLVPLVKLLSKLKQFIFK
jgi:glycosyltransferase